MRNFLVMCFMALLVISCSTQDEAPTVDTPPIVVTPAPGQEVCDRHRISDMSAPWSRPSTSIVIDAYELNSIDWDAMASDKRVVGVIHRSSIGSRVDKKYHERRNIAKSRGYLWGAYHLGDRSDIKAQADLLISLAGDDLMVLDLEDTASSKFMTIPQAHKFIDYVYSKTGRVPVIYANHSTTKKINDYARAHPEFKNLLRSKLWYARFKSSVTDFPAGVWPSYFLWQFSSEINCSKTGSCLYNVPGTRFDMDVNVFDGSAEELKARWHDMCR